MFLNSTSIIHLDMRTLKYLIAFVCLSSIAYASCNADDVSCEDPIVFSSGDFFCSEVLIISGY